MIVTGCTGHPSLVFRAVYSAIDRPGVEWATSGMTKIAYVIVATLVATIVSISEACAQPSGTSAAISGGVPPSRGGIEVSNVALPSFDGHLSSSLNPLFPGSPCLVGG